MNYCNDIHSDLCLLKPSYFVDNLFITFISLFGGFFISFAFVSHLLDYRKDPEEDNGKDFYADDEQDEDEEDDVDFADKYYEELNDLNIRDLTKEELSKLQFTYLDVETPDGLVKMNYNAMTESFWYYTDNKNIPYKYLDTVARFYAIVNNCRNICVNYKEELEKGVNSIKDQMDREAIRIKNLDNAIMETEKKSVFAKFKNYKTKDAKNVQKKYYVLTDKANIFKFAGSMNDYEISRKEKTDCVPKIDYATFKKMLDEQKMCTEMSTEM